ncbi:MAG: 50S ribosomal protein L10 [Candidatus Uhrbacteria bacterium GW2011_GWF2_41_16]|uniref:Large ribosomal subunit protein uL10 n=2 Tax=Candidatus Uhriibacteriota TaxID=1752732 RepID=A0A0G0VG30_9BACT|nr:MAG: 50S ribosomal protein L10 [Candidatus Uhrbacteria bacterium GW2011_GWA2_41_10]KKR87606.1 MAG: 50S ribosomal protein L10 [Candidatus Uhrbacteria bacterium GW2011_GWC2_41_11]KKR98586.1 MAG: 50S ribosomal protein L10 [Candidatus Uhrbacteria bacterium GW2011_GWF2_41_16]HBO99794.1 50S ribosomal protein L10 [Candidatus Uhrbacteria bacterium]
MSKTRTQKEAVVEILADKMRRMKSAAFVSVHGYTMKDADALRIKAKQAGVEVAVTKKTLLKRAADQAGFANFDAHAFEGSILSAFSFSDEVSAAKLLAALVKEKTDMKIVGGILEGEIVEVEKIKMLATLPGKQELLGKMVGSLQAPISGFVNVLVGNLRGLVTVLKAVQEKKPV